MSCLEIFQIILAVVGLIAAIVIGVIQIRLANKASNFESRQNSRDEKRRNAENYAIVTRFVQKYNCDGCESDISLLPLCAVAYAYDPTYPYRREIYREFCSFSEEIQNLILDRFGLKFHSIHIDDFYKMSVDKLISVIEKFYPDDKNIFYDNGKYFEQALTHHGNKVVPNLTCTLDSDEIDRRNHPLSEHVSFEPCMPYDTHIQNLLAWHKNEKPISKLFYENTNMGRPDVGDGIIISYLCCHVAMCAIWYNIESFDGSNIGSVCDFSGELYMEDLFLESLCEIFVNFDKMNEEALNHEN